MSALFDHFASPLFQQQLPSLPMLFFPLFLPFLPVFLSPSTSFVAAQCSGDCAGCGCVGCGGCQQLQLGGRIVFPMPSNDSSNGTESVTQNSTNGAVKLKELMPKMVVETKKNNGTVVLSRRRRRRNTTPTNWGSEKMLTPQQLEAKFQQIRLLQQRPLTPLQPDLPPLQPPDFPPISVPEGDARLSAYGDGESSGKLRPQSNSGMGQFIHVKPTVTGAAIEQRTDTIECEWEDPTLKHPFEEPFLK